MMPKIFAGRTFQMALNVELCVGHANSALVFSLIIAP